MKDNEEAASVLGRQVQSMVDRGWVTVENGKLVITEAGANVLGMTLVRKETKDGVQGR